MSEPVAEAAAPAADNKKKWLMIGLIGGGVLLIVISVVLAVVLSHGKSKKGQSKAHDTEQQAEEGDAEGGGEEQADTGEHGKKEGGHEKPKAEHGAETEHAATEEAHKPAEGGKPADEAALKAEADQLKQDIAKLQHEMDQQTEMLTLSDEAAKLKSEINALKEKKASLEGDKQKLAEGVKQIRSGEKKCAISGNPDKRLEELRACLGMSQGGEQKPGESKPAGDSHEVHWSYNGENGPEFWAKLKPEWKVCADGRTQSPINLVGRFGSGVPALTYEYKSSALTVVNNGHTIQANVAEGGGVVLEGKRYKLLQFHFHTPSEEQINGRANDMVAHLVHKSEDGKLLVIGVLLNRGKDNPVLKPVFDNMPGKASEEKAVPNAGFDANRLLPASRNYFHYDGSLTTPPCSEGVKWFVLKNVGNVSPKQYEAFTQLYPYNARPVQAVNGRTIVEN